VKPSSQTFGPSFGAAPFSSGEVAPWTAIPARGTLGPWLTPIPGRLSCTIIVSGASAWMAPYHDRMPVLLGESDIAGWLDGSLGGEALRPAAESTLREWIVSTRVNKTGEGDDDPTLFDAVEGEAA